MNSPNTLGPWHLKEWHGDFEITAKANSVNVAVVWGNDESDIANARLIAASPDLLDLAYQYLSDLRYPPTSDSRERRIERIQHVIAKATGAA